MEMAGTFWALVPAIAAIVLALITKEVYFSLFIGILAGALFFTGFQLMPALETITHIISDKVGGNINIVIFLIVLGMIVALLQKSGAARSYGEWASKRIHSKKSALGLSGILGVVIFVDDYFNCLTVGTVMKPITDKFKISRAQLAYIIDATAAPVCILAPISSWAAAVSSSLPSGSQIDGFSLFLKTIPFNYYAILTLIMVFVLIAFNISFSKMKALESKDPDPSKLDEAPEENYARVNKGKVIDLIAPVIMLIAFCVWFMLYTGGILEGESISSAFANCDSSLSLVYGSLFTLLFTALFYLPRKVINFQEFNQCLAEGFKAMVPALLILTFAWTLSGVSGEGYLEVGSFVSSVLESNNISLALVPVVFFLVALLLSFATGTSWGTFAILIPIIVTVFGDQLSDLMVLSVAACLAGAINGDHISPISDTTILSSAGAGCRHLDHVSTQIPYAAVVTIPSIIAYIAGGLSGQPWLGLAVALILLLVTLTVIKLKTSKKEDAQDLHKTAA